MLELPGATVDAVRSPHFTVRPSLIVSTSPYALTNTIDLSDRIQSFDITATKDEGVSRGEFTFSRGRGTDSLSPAVQSSTLRIGDRAALDPNLWVYLYLEIDNGPAFELWRGKIDRVGMTAQGKVRIKCRDLAALGLNNVLRYPVKYTATQGIKDRIDDLAFQAALQSGYLSVEGSEFNVFHLLGHIVEPVATSWVTNPYLQDSMSVLEAARRLVQTFGGDCRVVGRNGWDKVSIVLPNRSPVFDIHGNRWLTDLTLGPDRYTDITELEWGDEDIRNQWEGWYEGADGSAVGPIYDEDIESIKLYGPRYSRIYLDRAENITTDPEMARYLRAALLDNKDPFASHKISGPLLPQVELDDFHTYQANRDEYDTDLQLVVAAHTHHWHARQDNESEESAMPTTTIGARGQPIGAYREYRRSVPPRVLATTNTATPTYYAPERTVVHVVDSLS